MCVFLDCYDEDGPKDKRHPSQAYGPADEKGRRVSCAKIAVICS